MIDLERPAWLSEKLNALPRELAPEHDLWPEIARRIDRPKRSWLPVAVAASLAISAVSALFTWQILELRRQEAAAHAVALEYLQQIESPYLPARTSYEQQWNAVRGQVDPETAAIIERNLAIIRQANEELAAALKKQPDNRGMQQLLRRSLAKEVDVYQRAVDAARGSI